MYPLIINQSTVTKTKEPDLVPADGEQIPYTLHLLLENMKKQYLTMVQTMQTKVGPVSLSSYQLSGINCAQTGDLSPLFFYHL
jgi:hypothetical protein